MPLDMQRKVDAARAARLQREEQTTRQIQAQVRAACSVPHFSSIHHASFPFPTHVKPNPLSALIPLLRRLCLKLFLGYPLLLPQFALFHA